MTGLAAHLCSAVASAEMAHRHGRLTAFNGLVIESSGPDAHLGELCELVPGHGKPAVQAEVVGFRNQRVLLMPYGNVQGISVDCTVRATGRSLSIPVGRGLLGRVVDAFSQPLDDGPGIIYDDHPSLTRILMPDDWVGHPQRKDYPLGGIPVEYKGAVVPPPDQRRTYR